MTTLSLKQDVTPLIKIALPLALNGMVQSGVYFFETLFFAHVNEQTLAAGALVSWLFGTLAVILFGTMSSINILVSHKYGAEDLEGVRDVVRGGFLLALLLFFPAFLLFWNMSPIFLLFGQPESIVVLAQHYLHALAWGLFPDFIIRLFVLSAFFQIFEAIRISLFGALRALKDTRFTLIISIISFWGIALPIGYALTFYSPWQETGMWIAMVLSAVLSVLLLNWRVKFKLSRY